MILGIVILICVRDRMVGFGGCVCVCTRGSCLLVTNSIIFRLAGWFGSDCFRHPRHSCMFVFGSCHGSLGRDALFLSVTRLRILRVLRMR